MCDTKLMTAKFINPDPTEDYNTSFEVKTESELKALFEMEEGEDQLDGGSQADENDRPVNVKVTEIGEHNVCEKTNDANDVVNYCIHQYIEDFLDRIEGFEDSEVQTEYFLKSGIEEKNESALIVRDAINEFIKNAEKLDNFVDKVEETINVHWDSWVIGGVDQADMKGKCGYTCNTQENTFSGGNLVMKHTEMQRQESVN